MDTPAEAVSLVALTLSVLALTGSGVAWHFSRAQKLNAFQRNVAEMVEAWTGKIQAMDLKIQGQQTLLGDTLEAVTAVLERITRERKRAVQQNTKADERDGQAELDAAAPRLQTREEQVAEVNARFARPQ